MEKFIPLDKSWVIRMGVLDIVHGSSDIETFLAQQEHLSDDLLALQRASKIWTTDSPVDVGESGTLYRLLQFAAWKLGLSKTFVKRGTLTDRAMTTDPSIVNLSQKELLKLDNGTSQWASAAVLLGDIERLGDPPFKLRVTYDAVDHWHARRAEGKSWEPRYDETVAAQAEAFKILYKGERPVFEPKQAEDFCFAYLFGYMTAAEGEQKWPALRGHESDRISEMEQTREALEKSESVTSKDHRVVQAAAMWGRIHKKPVDITYPGAVSKSWPQFWDFLKSVS